MIVLLALRYSAAPAQTLAFVDVTVVDVDGGHLVPEQTVLITGNRIRTVGPSRRVVVPRDARIVDAKGKYLIPGLWDMHAHTELPGDKNVHLQDSIYRSQYPLYIANGVTGLREMTQRFPGGADSFRVWQRAVLAGTRVGPRAIGPSADLTYMAYEEKVALETEQDARRVIDSLKAAGMQFLKLHDEGMEAAPYFMLLREARRAGIPVAGHVSTNLTAAAASDSGQHSIEHIWQNRPCWLDLQVDSAAAQEGCAAMVQTYIRNDTWVVPTALVLSLHLNGELLPKALYLVGAMHRWGLQTLLAGSDCATEFNQRVAREYPDKWASPDSTCHRGFSVLQEIGLFAQAGLTPLEALRTATLNPAKFLRATDSLGTVASGKLADLVLLDADPLADIRNVMRIRAVVANGRYFDRATLDALDPEATRLARRFADYPTFVPGSVPSATPVATDDTEP